MVPKPRWSTIRCSIPSDSEILTRFLVDPCLACGVHPRRQAAR
jgi:hypothetical protein